MAILHTVNSSPFSTSALQDCLKQLGEGDKLLLISDAVIAASASLDFHETLIQLYDEGRLFVLEADLQARGLSAALGNVIDYAVFVQLSVECQSQLAW